MSKIVLTGGGTAGHITPNIALIPYLKKDFDGVFYIGLKNGMEKSLAENTGLTFYGITAAKLSREITPKNLLIPFKIMQGFNHAKKILNQIKPDVVFSKGGYVSVPVVYAAKTLKIPVVTHESDLSIGLANKLISPCSDKILTSFPETAEKIKNAVFVGSPIRNELFAYDKKTALSFYGFDGTKPVLLILGGSQGSQTINDCVENAAAELLPQFDILHICGKGNLPKTQCKGKVSIEFEPDIGKAFAAADLAITRAGANSLFELLALKIPSIAVPLCKNSRGDQIQNAEYFFKKGLLNVIYEENLTQKSLLASVSATYADRYNFKRRLESEKFSSATEKVAEVLSTYAKN